MLIIDDNSVYEIDEECMKKRKAPKECQTYEKMLQSVKNKDTDKRMANHKK